MLRGLCPRLPRDVDRHAAPSLSQTCATPRQSTCFALKLLPSIPQQLDLPLASRTTVHIAALAMATHIIITWSSSTSAVISPASYCMLLRNVAMDVFETRWLTLTEQQQRSPLGLVWSGLVSRASPSRTPLASKRVRRPACMPA